VRGGVRREEGGMVVGEIGSVGRSSRCSIEPGAAAEGPGASGRRVARGDGRRIRRPLFPLPSSAPSPPLALPPSTRTLSLDRPSTPLPECLPLISPRSASSTSSRPCSRRFTSSPRSRPSHSAPRRASMSARSSKSSMVRQATRPCLLPPAASSSSARPRARSTRSTRW
jgi:hypothetical protein